MEKNNLVNAWNALQDIIWWEMNVLWAALQALTETMILDGVFDAHANVPHAQIASINAHHVLKDPNYFQGEFAKHIKEFYHRQLWMKIGRLSL